jgi:hypothetical protein
VKDRHTFVVHILESKKTCILTTTVMKLSKVYQPRIILVKDEDGDMLGGFYSILFR